MAQRRRAFLNRGFQDWGPKPIGETSNHVVILNALQTLMERNGQPAGGDAPHNHSSATGGGAGSAPATQALSSPHYLFKTSAKRVRVVPCRMSGSQIKSVTEHLLLCVRLIIEQFDRGDRLSAAMRIVVAFISLFDLLLFKHLLLAHVLSGFDRMLGRSCPFPSGHLCLQRRCCAPLLAEKSKSEESGSGGGKTIRHSDHSTLGPLADRTSVKEVTQNIPHTDL
ncbi:hypothetical protein GPALN_004979 [Globodera pallida]|nr:hypothetical protein GPALN_004979 [Globodera pallida]